MEKKKPKSKEARCKEHAKALFCGSVANLAEVIAKLPAPPTKQQVDRMLQNRFDLSVEAALIFDDNWARVRGRFKESLKDKEEDEEED